jgi:dUTP pyrophosphatase
VSCVTVQIKPLPASGDIPLPTRATGGSAGFDLHAAVEADVELPAGEIRLIPCGFAMALPEGHEAQVRARSGLASKFGLTPVNGVGTIDADYRGEVKVPLINLGRQPFTVTRGMRIAQLVVQRLPTVVFEQTRTLAATARGSGGFGHTGTEPDRP